MWASFFFFFRLELPPSWKACYLSFLYKHSPMLIFRNIVHLSCTAWDYYQSQRDFKRSVRDGKLIKRKRENHADKWWQIVLTVASGPQPQPDTWLWVVGVWPTGFSSLETCTASHFLSSLLVLCFFRTSEVNFRCPNVYFHQSKKCVFYQLANQR